MASKYPQSAYKVPRVVYSVEYDAFVWLLLVVVIALTPYFIPIGLFNLSFPSPFVRKEMLSGRGGYDNKSFITENSGEGDSWFAKRTLSVTPLLTVAILFTFTQCGIIGGGKKKGDAPWLLLSSGVNSNTPSVDSPSNGNSSGGSGGSGGSALVPVIGMYFLHPDHLGSITMITDGRGNVIAGGNNGGKSHISYTPYGSIHRTDSSGPDITRFKYTGQEEDKESGLMYYKARYYDPMIGRFLQADSVVMPQSTFGMNRYMYVEGNPVRWSDRSGHASAKPSLTSVIDYLSNSKIFSNSTFGSRKAYDLYRNKQKDNAIQKASKDINGGIHLKEIKAGIEWGSRNIRNSGLRQAADTFNRATGQDYEHQNRNRCKYSLGNGKHFGYSPLCELGLRGGKGEFDDFSEKLGLGANGLNLFVNLGVPPAVAAALDFLTGSIFAVGMAFSGAIIDYGDRYYRKEHNRRTLIEFFKCGYIAITANKGNSEGAGYAALYCGIQFYDSKD